MDTFKQHAIYAALAQVYLLQGKLLPLVNFELSEEAIEALKELSRAAEKVCPLLIKASGNAPLKP